MRFSRKREKDLLMSSDLEKERLKLSELRQNESVQELPQNESARIAISVQNISKCYHLYETPRDRLKQFVLPRIRRLLHRPNKQYFREFWSLRNLSFEVKQGEALGIIGKNGAGKSTLLQLLCGTLTPTAGTVQTNGRIAALLELGAGFNPEFTGRENVYLNASVLGLSQSEIDERFDEIEDFADIGLFIDQPVKSYSSGMFVRLAFSIATSVDPDILIVDEALSVGDGAFSRKSFDRIMELKKRGTTILFCSHALYQTEVFCDRALWLDKGNAVMLDRPHEVISRYSASLLEAQDSPPAIGEAHDQDVGLIKFPRTTKQAAPAGQAHFTGIKVSMDGVVGSKLKGVGSQSELAIRIEFVCDPNLPVPTVGVTIDYGSLLAVTCVSSHTDEIVVSRDEIGQGTAEVVFPRVALRKGKYLIGAYLNCENALHFYDVSLGVAELDIEDDYPEPGLVALPHYWNACMLQTEDIARSNDKEVEALVSIHGQYLIEVDRLDSLGLKQNNGIFEVDEVSLCRLLIKEGDRVLDIGANIGYFTLLFAGAVSSEGKVIAIEPDVDNFQLLQRNIALNKLTDRVKTYSLALGSQANSARLYHSDSNNGMHRLYPSVCCTLDSTEVSVVVGDSLDLVPLDFIKIDIEGYEPAALKGLYSTIKSSPRLKILSEFSPLSMWEAGFSPTSFLREMQQHEFQLFCLEDKQWREKSFDDLHSELAKIPPSEVATFISDLKQTKDIQETFKRADEFLRKHSYMRPMVENILFVASAVAEEVRVAIRTQN